MRKTTTTIYCDRCKVEIFDDEEHEGKNNASSAFEFKTDQITYERGEWCFGCREEFWEIYDKFKVSANGTTTANS